MLSGLIIGYDPGGDDAHGLAELQVHNGSAISLSTRTVSTTEHVLSFLDILSTLAVLGIDTLTCWSTGPGGWRPADRWLRQRYPAVRNSIVAPNGLYGSMGLNGMAVVVATMQRFHDILITETHPKVLYWYLTRARYDYHNNREAMNRVLALQLGISVSPQTEHEWDAAISAFAALEGSGGRWRNDLHRIRTDASERLIEPCGLTHYFWPE